MLRSPHRCESVRRTTMDLVCEWIRCRSADKLAAIVHRFSAHHIPCVKMHTDQIAAVVMNHRTLNLAYIRLVYRIWSLLNNPYNPCSPSYRCSAPTATTTMPLQERHSTCQRRFHRARHSPGPNSVAGRVKVKLVCGRIQEGVHS